MPYAATPAIQDKGATWRRVGLLALASRRGRSEEDRTASFGQRSGVERLIRSWNRGAVEGPWASRRRMPVGCGQHLEERAAPPRDDRADAAEIAPRPPEPEDRERVEHHVSRRDRPLHDEPTPAPRAPSRSLLARRRWLLASADVIADSSVQRCVPARARQACPKVALRSLAIGVIRGIAGVGPSIRSGMVGRTCDPFVRSLTTVGSSCSDRRLRLGSARRREHHRLRHAVMRAARIR